MYCLRSNMDIKPISHNRDGKCLTVYMTDYETKSEMKTHNVIALAAQVRERDGKGESVPETLAKRMAVKILNKVNVMQEVSAPMVSQLLLGYGDHFKSHTFERLHVGPLLSELQQNVEEDQEKEEAETEEPVVVLILTIKTNSTNFQ